MTLPHAFVCDNKDFRRIGDRVWVRCVTLGEPRIEFDVESKMVMVDARGMTIKELNSFFKEHWYGQHAPIELNGNLRS